MDKKITDHKYMLVLDDRVFYCGLLGHKMKTRQLGAVSVYVAPVGSFRLKGAAGEWTRHSLAILPAYEAHQVVSDCGEIISVLIEPDRLESFAVEALLAEFADPANRDALIGRLRSAATRFAALAPDGEITTSAFDQVVLGRELAEREIDRRIKAALEELEEEGMENPLQATDIAQTVGLSSSRFLHLFKEQTGVSFRNYRMWRRARSFLLHANHSNSLTDVALSLGYPDSSHFSHSIRRTFGLQPRSIRIGSQNLRVDSSVRAAVGLYA